MPQKFSLKGQQMVVALFWPLTIKTQVKHDCHTEKYMSSFVSSHFSLQNTLYGCEGTDANFLPVTYSFCMSLLTNHLDGIA